MSWGLMLWIFSCPCSTKMNRLKGRHEHDKSPDQLPSPATPDEARELPSGSHFIDPKGKRRSVP